MVTDRAFGQIMDERDNPSFFKILRREHLSSDIMRGIPFKFIKSISDKEFSAKIVLQVSWGNSWTIRIFRNSDFHYMEKSGWEQFLRDNALGNNEFLTFTHKGHMNFSVVIYQIDALEMLRPHKSATIVSSSCRNQREQSNNNIYTDMKKDAIESSSESSYRGPKIAESTGRRQRISSRDKKAEEIEKAKKMKKKTRLETVYSSSEAETSSLVPELTISITKSYLLYLGIPKSFLMHMPKETTRFTIHHPNGKKSWDVMYVITGTQSRFSAGWIRLAKDMALVVGDVCTFKLIKPTEMLLQVSRKGTPGIM